MAHPLSFFQRLMLPFMGPPSVAKMISKLPPRSAAYVVETFSEDKAYKILLAMDDQTKQRIYNTMSHFFLTKVFREMPPQLAASSYLSLQPSLARKLTKNVTNERLELMLTYWSDKDLVFVLTNFQPVKAAFVLSLMSEDRQTAILPQLQTWVQAALIKDMPPEVRSEVIDRMNLEPAIDLLTRWSLEDQSSVLRSVSKGRRQEIFNTMRPRTIAELLEFWSQEEVLSFMNSIEEKQMTMILFNFSDNVKKTMFRILPPDKQRYVIANLQTNQAIVFLRYLEDDEIIAHLNALDSDTRRLLVRQLEEMEN
jgi:Mg/Co/Ni transporter MgtE